MQDPILGSETPKSPLLLTKSICYVPNTSRIGHKFDLILELVSNFHLRAYHILLKAVRIKEHRHGGIVPLYNRDGPKSWLGTPQGEESTAFEELKRNIHKETTLAVYTIEVLKSYSIVSSPTLSAFY